MAYQMDFFAADTLAKVTAAIEAKKVQYPAYVFIRNEDGATGRLAFVDQNNVLKYIVGSEAKKQVVNVETLPEVGDVEVLYIMEGIVYVFNGEEYIPAYKDHSAELADLTARVEALEQSSADAASVIEGLMTEVESLKTVNSELAAELETVTEQVTKFEDRIVEVEKSTLTFVELE